MENIIAPLENRTLEDIIDKAKEHGQLEIEANDTTYEAKLTIHNVTPKTSLRASSRDTVWIREMNPDLKIAIIAILLRVEAIKDFYHKYNKNLS